MLKSFVRTGTLKVVDADGKAHVFAGAPGPKVTMRLTDRSLYHKLFLQSGTSCAARPIWMAA